MRRDLMRRWGGSTGRLANDEPRRSPETATTGRQTVRRDGRACGLLSSGVLPPEKAVFGVLSAYFRRTFGELLPCQRGMNKWSNAAAGDGRKSQKQPCRDSMPSPLTRGSRLAPGSFGFPVESEFAPSVFRSASCSDGNSRRSAPRTMKNIIRTDRSIIPTETLPHRRSARTTRRVPATGVQTPGSRPFPVLRGSLRRMP